MQQPWAWAIVAGGKTVENRTQLWTYRGPLLIHAGQRWSDRGGRSPLIGGARLDWLRDHGWTPSAGRSAVLEEYTRRGVPRSTELFPTGVILGAVDLVDVHPAEAGCCDSPWAEQSYAEHGGKTRRDVVHLVLENPVELLDPIPYAGRLGLWTPDPDVEAAVPSRARRRVASWCSSLGSGPGEESRSSRRKPLRVPTQHGSVWLQQATRRTR